MAPPPELLAAWHAVTTHPYAAAGAAGVVLAAIALRVRQKRKIAAFRKKLDRQVFEREVRRWD